MSKTTTTNTQDGSTSYTTPQGGSNPVAENGPKLISDAAQNMADNANGNVAGSTPPIQGYQGR